MQKLNVKSDKKTVGVAAHSDPLKEKGITLIALIITIIVMLILVGVTVNITLSGGLFSKAEEAGSKTKIAQIQEALTLKKAEILADKRGKAPDDYGITFDKLDLPTELETEYGRKLIISKDAILYYDASVVTNIPEQNRFKEMGIQPYVETSISDFYEFTVGELIAKEGAQYSEVMWNIPIENFWPDNVSEELKTSTVQRQISGEDGIRTTYSNITCEDLTYVSAFDAESVESLPNMYLLCVDNGIIFAITDANGDFVSESDYGIYSELTFRIELPE